MNRKTLIALLGAIAVAVAISGGALAASPAGPTVNVQIKTFKKTLRNVMVRGETGSITKGGTPKGVCSGKSAAGALDRATNGHWSAKYFSSVPGIFVTSILHVKPRNPHYWALVVNGKTSLKGICDVKLKVGEKLLFKLHK